jgi:RNA polymerase sigma factor (sigma-70 family)
LEFKPASFEFMPASAGEPHPSAGRDPETPEVLRVLVENHRRFLAFLERRVGSREAAEDILQDAFVRGLQRARSVRNEQSIVAWFYRLLRNAIVDHYRRRAAEERALAHVAGTAVEAEPGPDEALHHEVCACISGLVKTLKPEYAAAVQRVDLDGATVAAFASEAGITANNAAVRLHRAHEALRRQLILCCGTCATHGCLDCSCGGPRRLRDLK